MIPCHTLPSLLLLPVVLASALPEISLTPAQSALVDKSYASFTASIAQASASASHAAKAAAYTAPTLVKTDVPSANNVTCQIDRSKPNINIDNCADVYEKICENLISSAKGTFTADAWVWSSSTKGDCSMGYWYPSSARGVAVVPPDVATCASNADGIWLQMQQACIIKASGPWRSGVRWNAASMNVGKLPENNLTDTAIDVRQVSYLLASEPLT